MASLDQLIDELQRVSEKIDEAITQAGAAEEEAGELQSQFSGMGAEAQASAVGGIKDGIDSLQSYLRGGMDQTNELIEQVKAAKG